MDRVKILKHIDEMTWTLPAQVWPFGEMNYMAPTIHRDGGQLTPQEREAIVRLVLRVLAEAKETEEKTGVAA